MGRSPQLTTFTPKRDRMLDQEYLVTSFQSSKLRPSLLTRTVPSLGRRQRELVGLVGFGFIRFYPASFRLNQGIYAWLLSVVDVSKPGLVSDSGVVVLISREDVVSVQGVLPVGSVVAVDEEDAKLELAKVLSVGYAKAVMSMSRCRSVLLK